MTENRSDRLYCWPDERQAKTVFFTASQLIHRERRYLRQNIMKLILLLPLLDSTTLFTLFFLLENALTACERGASMMVRVCTLHCIVMRKIHISTIYLLLLLLVHRLFFTIKYIKIIVLSLSLHIELVFLQHFFFFFLRRPPLPSPCLHNAIVGLTAPTTSCSTYQVAIPPGPSFAAIDGKCNASNLRKVFNKKLHIQLTMCVHLITLSWAV